MIGDIRRLLLLPHVKVQNANALSSPYTIGFPAMTAWLGAVHALQRKLNGQFSELKFKATAIISHECNLQTYKGVGDYVHSIVGTGNPLDKTGSRSAFIEEARCHLDVSLVIEYSGVGKDYENILASSISRFINSKMKIAGGDILTFNSPQFLKIEDGNDTELRKMTRKLMPGYVIVERRELMIGAMENDQDAIDSLLDALAIHHNCERDGDGNISWLSKRKTAGWLVPIATGFHGVTELGQAKNQRDPDVSHRFAESIVTLGEFKMPYCIKSLDEILWSYHHDIENDLYLCQQSKYL